MLNQWMLDGRIMSWHTFLSEVDAPEPVQPVVYSPVPPRRMIGIGKHSNRGNHEMMVKSSGSKRTHEDVEFFEVSHVSICQRREGKEERVEKRCRKSTSKLNTSSTGSRERTVLGPRSGDA